MKYIILLALLSCTKPEPLATYIDKITPKMEVISILGQSNVPGRVLVKELSPEDKAKMQIGNKATYIMAYHSGSENEFQVGQVGKNVAEFPDRCGIQTFLGHKLLRYQEGNRYIFQAAASGRFIKAFHPDGEMGMYITSSVAKIKAYALQQNKKADFKYAVWYQGEAEAVRKDWDSSYYRKELEHMIDRFRKETDTDTKFIIIQFPMDYRQCPKQNLIEIRDVQRKIGGQRNNVLIEAVDLDKTIDGIHIDKETTIRKADIIYNLIRY